MKPIACYINTHIKLMERLFERRNRELLADYNAGVPVKQLVQDYDISRQRVHLIIRTHKVAKELEAQP